MPKTITPDERFQASIEGFPVAGEPVEIEPLERAVRVLLSNTVKNRVEIDALLEGAKRLRSVSSLDDLTGLNSEEGEVVQVNGYGLYVFDKSWAGNVQAPLAVRGVGGVWRHILHSLIGRPGGLGTLNIQGELEQPLPNESVHTQHLANESVTASKLAPGSVTPDKLNLKDNVGENHRIGNFVLHDGGCKIVATGARWNTEKRSWERLGSPAKGGMMVCQNAVGLFWVSPGEAGTTTPLSVVYVAHPQNGEAYVTTDLKPTTPYDLGDFSHPWESLYTRSGPVLLSDAREKRDVALSDLGLNFIRELRPVRYRWIVGGYEQAGFESVEDPLTGQTVLRPKMVPRPGQRFHYGLIAQEVKEALTRTGVTVTDFGGIKLENPSDPESRMSLDYTQFIAPLIRAIQELAEQVDALKERLNALEAQVISEENGTGT